MRCARGQKSSSMLESFFWSCNLTAEPHVHRGGASGAGADGKGRFHTNFLMYARHEVRTNQDEPSSPPIQICILDAKFDVNGI